MKNFPSRVYAFLYSGLLCSSFIGSYSYTGRASETIYKTISQKTLSAQEKETYSEAIYNAFYTQLSPYNQKLCGDRNKENFYSYLNKNDYKITIAEGEEILGCAISVDCCIVLFFVIDRLHGSAIASNLMNQVIKGSPECQQLCLTVYSDNSRAIEFYKKWGFEEPISTYGSSSIENISLIRKAAPVP